MIRQSILQANVQDMFSVILCIVRSLLMISVLFTMWLCEQKRESERVYIDSCLVGFRINCYIYSCIHTSIRVSTNIFNYVLIYLSIKCSSIDLTISSSYIYIYRHIFVYLSTHPGIYVTLPLGIYVGYARTLCNLYGEAFSLLCERIVGTATAGYIQITSGGLIGTIGSAIRVHLVQSRIGQCTRNGITGHTVRSQVGSFLGHL